MQAPARAPGCTLLTSSGTLPAMGASGAADPGAQARHRSSQAREGCASVLMAPPNGTALLDR